MSDIELTRLRNLRHRAEALLSTLVSDLKPFQHEVEANGFCRRPDSPMDPDDVNVTTTCSCLMALTLAGKLNDFYEDPSKDLPGSIFKNLVDAPWMSSGLTENNAFTTTLVLRTFGFLAENNRSFTKLAKATKTWELKLGIQNLPAFAARLVDKNDPVSAFVHSLLPKVQQKTLQEFVGSGKDEKKLERQLTNELSRLVRTTVLYEADRFKGVTLSAATKDLCGKSLDGYNITHLNGLLLRDVYGPLLSPLGPKTLEEIAGDMAAEPANFKINDYPTAAAVVYWFVDGIARSEINLPPKSWDHLSEWATQEFARQRSLVVAKHAAMMDPVAMAMSACLCARLRSLSIEGKLGTNNNHHAMLPSMVELERSIVELFKEQTLSGIWPKYFPLFHYQEAGSNFCFTFELLEAVLKEFGGEQNSLIGDELFVEGLERAVAWCDKNRVECSEQKKGKRVPFFGWSSGGFLETLRKGQPESWATAVVHMFLWELIDALSRHIQKRLLEKYKANLPSKKWKMLNRLLDIDVWIDKQHKPLTQILSTTIVRSFGGQSAAKLRQRAQNKAPLSALLFGPPGTSKTEVAKAIAKELDWPLVEIDPSNFLQNGFEGLYVQAEKIFEDVMDLSGVVILFDEMDALVQRRDEAGVDTESKFLTTYMLPKLSKLHGRGRVVFFMATNFQAKFDDAIKRAGRFDFLLCMGPPTLRAKCDGLHQFYGADEEETDQTRRAGHRILDFCEADMATQQQLELYTFGDFGSFITSLASKSEIGTFLESMPLDEFIGEVKKDSGTATLKFEQLREILQKHGCKTVADLDPVDLVVSQPDILIPVIKYVLDRKQSRWQCAHG
jgi:hypothetical protein